MTARPVAPLVRCGALVVSGVLVLSGCGGGSERDLSAFCDAVEDLARNDPFEDLAVASPGEMRTAFDDLHEQVDRIAAVAPDDLRPGADRYAASVDELIDLLSGAGFDPRNLDTLAYRSATSEYEAAAVSVENAADRACE